MPTMPAALLAVLLLTATVDPRPAEPLRLLADVGAHDTTDGHVGPQFASLPESLGLTLAVAELPRGAVGFYDQRSRTVTIAEGLIGEDPRAVAVILAHELQHALDLKRVAIGLLDRDCLALEVRGFEAQAIVSRLFWPDALPNGTALERNIAAVVRDYERNGTAGVSARLAGDASYQELCATWPA
jgi:hypothetical protein